MLIFTMFGWWYTAGFGTRLRSLEDALARTVDRFSIGLLLRTLFRPFRQIDAHAEGKGIEAALSAAFSRFISRLVGFFARLFLILAGLIVLFVQCIFSATIIILHVFIPVIPVIGLVLALTLSEVHLW